MIVASNQVCLKSSSARNVLNYMALQVAYDVDIYFASIIESATIGCLLLDQIIAPLASRNKNLVVDI
jgi:hypothetical protein